MSSDQTPDPDAFRKFEVGMGVSPIIYIFILRQD
jgi:hypothetical protein